MSLFSKKPPCPIRSGKISWFLPQKIEGHYVCDKCYFKIDMDKNKASSLTMQGFREYLAFYEQNQFLKDKFVISERIDFGVWDTKIIFDYQNKLFCMSNEPNKTVFEGKQLKSFTIKEDMTPLFEGSAQGIRRYTSTVPERVMALAPQISQYIMNKRIGRVLDRLDDGKENGSTTTYYFDVPEPFKKFNVELKFDHPYWTVIKCDMDGPFFDNNYPDVNDYIREYESRMQVMEKLVTALKTVTFPEAPEQVISSDGTQAMAAAAQPHLDPIEEIKKYKSLMEEGIISKEEFEAKKKQILGI